ncbi:MAG TPA: hypothetical protein VHV08_03000, partial [Pirellulales bacterium]|nr:hypothetical protein [Pirellulales bacterium]
MTSYPQPAPFADAGAIALERELSAFYLALAAASVAMWLLIAGRLRQGRALSARTASPPVPWSIWDVALVLAVWVVLEGAAGQASATGADPTVLTPRTMAALGMARLAWFAIAAAYLKLRAGATAADLGFDMARLKSDVPFGLQVFLAAVLPVYAIQWLLVETLGYESEHPLAKLVAEHSNVAVL